MPKTARKPTTRKPNSHDGAADVRAALRAAFEADKRGEAAEVRIRMRWGTARVGFDGGRVALRFRGLNPVAFEVLLASYETLGLADALEAAADMSASELQPGALGAASAHWIAPTRSRRTQIMVAGLAGGRIWLQAGDLREGNMPASWPVLLAADEARAVADALRVAAEIVEEADGGGVCPHFFEDAVPA